jgi:hypothetical protein
VCLKCRDLITPTPIRSKSYLDRSLFHTIVNSLPNFSIERPKLHRKPSPYTYEQMSIDAPIPMDRNEDTVP